MEYEYKLFSAQTARQILRRRVALNMESSLEKKTVAGIVSHAEFHESKALDDPTDYLIISIDNDQTYWFGYGHSDKLTSIDYIDHEGFVYETLEDVEAEPEEQDLKVEPFEIRDANGALLPNLITINLSVDDQFSETWDEQKIADSVATALFWKLQNGE